MTEVVTLPPVQQQKEPLAAPQQKDPANVSAVCYPCTRCEDVFASSELLRIHMQDEHLSEFRSVDNSSLTASGRPIQLTPNFGSRHNNFMKTINLDNIEVEDLSDVDDDGEIESQPNFECNHCSFRNVRAETLLRHKENTHPTFTCSVCRERFTDVTHLQEHILTKHCVKTDAITEALKMHLQLLSSVLSNQATIEQRLSNMALKQSCLATDINTVKESQKSAVTLRSVENPPPPSLMSVATTAPMQQPPSCPSTYAQMTRPAAPLQLPLPPQSARVAPQGLTRAPLQTCTPSQKYYGWVIAYPTMWTLKT